MPGIEMVTRTIKIIKCSEMDQKLKEEIISLAEEYENVNDEEKMREIDCKILRLLGFECRDDYYIVIGYVDEKMNEDMASDDFPFLTWSRRCLEEPDMAVIEIRQEL